MTDEAIVIERLDAAAAQAALPGLADLLLDCVEGGASIGFMWPLPRERALAFWRGIADGVARGERVLLVAREAGGRIVGTVQLVTALPDNQPHRADVAKMQVLRAMRRRGIAERLLARLDDEARAAGRTLLVLDAVTGGDAERLYLRLGWQAAGVVPDYALYPDGRPCATTYCYKRL